MGPGGRNPAYNNVKRKVITYEVTRGGRTQVVWNDLGQGVRAASSFRGTAGDGNSSNPVVANAGYYIAFESRRLQPADQRGRQAGRTTTAIPTSTSTPTFATSPCCSRCRTRASRFPAAREIPA